MKTHHFFTLAFLIVSLSLISFEVRAVSLFADISLEGIKGPYLVIKRNVNVRKSPSNKGKKLSKLQRRDTVEVLGRVKGTQWVAVRKNGADLGFVYALSLTPIIDASFKGSLSGRLDMRDDDKPECSFDISFEGHFEETETIFVSSDYLARFKCQMGFDTFQFTAMMFMSEIPHDLGQKPIYQITLNLPEIATGYEEYLSATSLYHQKDKKVVMDAVSLKAFKEKDFRKSLPATTPNDALIGAVKLQLQSFNEKAWRTISGRIPSPGIKQP